jgi:hypothetical protein
LYGQKSRKILKNHKIGKQEECQGERSNKTLIHNLLFFRGQAKYTGHRGFGMKTMQELPGDREGVCIVGGFAARTEAA